MAIRKVSGSPRRKGLLSDRIVILNEIKRAGRVSLIKKVGINLILSLFVWALSGFEDPVSCNRIRWTRAMARIAMGIMKCREKNRLRVG